MQGSVDTAIIAVAISLAGALISYISYRGRVREVRLTANERLMRMVIDIDKEMISHPELMWLTRPDEFSKPDLKDEKARARVKAFMYMHLNMFDVAFNYYNETLGMTPFKRKFVLSREEIDHWDGWKNYMSWFLRLEYVQQEFFSKEKSKWYGARFKNFMEKLVAASPAQEKH